MSDIRHASRKVKFDERRSGSVRAPSTVGGSSTTSSGYSSGTAYPEPGYGDQRYNIAALEQSMQKTVTELDDWRTRALDLEDKLRKHENQTKARISALEVSVDTLQEANKDFERNNKSLKKEVESLREDRKDDRKDLEREVKSLKKELESLKADKKELKEKNARLQKKLDKLDSHSEPSSPDSSRPRRSGSDSKRSKEDDQTARLKDRLNKHSSDGSNSDISTSKPPSSSKPPSRGRRPSASGERPYIENWGPGPTATMPVSPNTGIRRPENYTTTAGYTIPVAQSTVSSSVPRSARPSVEYVYPSPPAYR